MIDEFIDLCRTFGDGLAHAMLGQYSSEPLSIFRNEKVQADFRERMNEARVCREEVKRGMESRTHPTNWKLPESFTLDARWLLWCAFVHDAFPCDQPTKYYRGGDGSFSVAWLEGFKNHRLLECASLIIVALKGVPPRNLLKTLGPAGLSPVPDGCIFVPCKSQAPGFGWRMCDPDIRLVDGHYGRLAPGIDSIVEDNMAPPWQAVHPDTVWWSNPGVRFADGVPVAC